MIPTLKIPLTICVRIILAFFTLLPNLPAHAQLFSNPDGYDDYGESIAVDKEGNTYITGNFTGRVTFGSITLIGGGIFIAKYNAAGKVLWVKKAVGTGYRFGKGIAVDTAGNSYVTGTFEKSITFDSTSLSSGGNDMFIAKLDLSGKVIWAKNTGIQGRSASLEGNEITVDAAGNSYVIGSMQGTAIIGADTLTHSAFHADIFLAKYDANGNPVWAKLAGGLDKDHGRDIAIDASGNVIITGCFVGQATFDTVVLKSKKEREFFIAKYHPSGNVIWVKTIDKAINISAVAADDSGGFVVTGFLSKASENGNTTLTANEPDHIFITRYDPDGNEVWTQRADGMELFWSLELELDQKGNAYVAGNFLDVAVFNSNILRSKTKEIFIAKYDASGNPVWTKQVSKKGRYNVHNLTTDSTGNIYMTGFRRFFSLNSNSKIFLAKFDSSGTRTWLKKTRWHRSK